MKNHLILSAALSIALASCGNPNSNSQNGHFEDSSAEGLAAYAGLQTALPEYAPNDQVLVSLPLITFYGKEDMIKAMLDAGTKRVLIAIPMGSPLTLNSPTFSKLRNLLGTDMARVSLVTKEKNGQISVWARDWGPFSARTAEGSLRLLDFNYYPERPADDRTPQDMSSYLGTDRISMPIYIEGGNFMNDDAGNCFMSDVVIDENSEQLVEGDLVLSAAEIADYFKTYAGCSQVRFLPHLPYEGTGHIDMWTKLVSNDTVIVNDLSDETIAFMPAADQAKGREIQAFLRNRQAEFKSWGYTVKLFPMPAPKPSVDLFRSYTNGLQINATVVTPAYKHGINGIGISYKYPDASLLPSYEAAVKNTFQELGLKSIFIETDELIRDGGSIHCSSMQISAAR